MNVCNLMQFTLYRLATSEFVKVAVNAVTSFWLLVPIWAFWVFMMIFYALLCLSFSLRVQSLRDNFRWEFGKKNYVFTVNHVTR